MAEQVMTAGTVETLREPGQRRTPAQKSVDVSILIVTWNSARWIGRCLASVKAGCGRLSHEVIVCDNASDDESARLAIGADAVIESPRNAGFAAATNRAYSASRGRFVFLLNPDCEVVPGAIETLYEFLQEHPRAAVAAPLLESEDGGAQRDFQLRRLPTLGSLLAEVFGLTRIVPRLEDRLRYRDLDLSKPQRVEQPAGAALLIRREAFEEIGLLDERFAPAWFEDVDYCRRLAAAGKEIWIVPSAPVKHFGGSSLEYLSFAEFNDVWYRNMWLYARKWLGGGKSEALRWAIIAGMMMRSIAALLGVAHPELGRRNAFRAYANVMENAFHRWDGSSRSS